MELKKGSHLSASITTASTYRRLCLRPRERFCARESAGKHQLTVNSHPAQRQNKVAGAHVQRPEGRLRVCSGKGVDPDGHTPLAADFVISSLVICPDKAA